MNDPVLSLEEFPVCILQVAVETGIFDGHGGLVRQQGKKADVLRGNGPVGEEVVHGHKPDRFFFDDQRNGSKGPAANQRRSLELTADSEAAF